MCVTKMNLTAILPTVKIIFNIGGKSLFKSSFTSAIACYSYDFINR